jgi:hypothetical protein
MANFFSRLADKLLRRSAPVPDDSSGPEQWLVYGTTHGDGDKKVFVIRDHMPQGIVAADYSCCVVFEWRLATEMPGEAEMAAIRQFEDHVEALDETGGNSVLMHVITGLGKREWCYYTKNYRQFMERLNGLLTGKPRYPIGIEFQENTDWRYWQSILELVEKKA